MSHFYNESTASGNDEAGQINPNELIAKITVLKTFYLIRIQMFQIRKILEST